MPKSEDPHQRIGVYKTVEQVPDYARLSHYTASYSGRDVWSEYYNAELSDAAETVEYEAGLVEESWKGHMDECGRHHALAKPADVEAWFTKLVDRMQYKRAYNPYWVRLEEFYDYLVWHTDHPHTYHPARMAAGQGGVTNEIWCFKIRER
ncbi:hypothetical protein [Halorubrum sp. Atlit-26R]|uniref:hypothetical protein n=1 Tax=Halorubrum sp. Atlit-26R TaxID=2282128 RepID=UPI0018F5C2B9|nr:hypothetical protein [Halorubrum sp. Atlit-26R]